jgi:hypothetical protein
VLGEPIGDPKAIITGQQSHDVDVTLTGPGEGVDACTVEPTRVLLTMRRAVDLVRCASALCRPSA